MGWIGLDVDRAESLDEIDSIWIGVRGDLPQRTADDNDLRCVGTAKSEEEAKARLENMTDREIYGMVYIKVETGKESAKLRDAKILLEKETKKLKDFLIESSVYKTHNGKTVGCQKCGSSFPVDYFKRYRNSWGWGNGRYWYPSTLYDEDGEYINSCPICGEEMRSNTALNRIAGYRRNISEYRKRVQDLMEAEKHKPFYLYKIAAYCG